LFLYYHIGSIRSKIKECITISNGNSNKYILLVDDAKDTVYTFDVYLKSLGYSTISFVNPVEALNYFNKNFTNCILIITDYSMPQMSGLDLIQKIRETDRNYKIKTIVISATVKNNIINYNDKFLNLKIDKFLEKPLSLEELKNEVKKLIN
jgi:CheY-like chemotaxis protein